MIVTSPLFEAYLECTTKCWLRARAEPNTGNTYAEWVRLKNETYNEGGRKRLLTMFPENSRAIEPALSKHAKEFIWRVATNVHLQVNGLESLLHGVEKVPSKKRARPVQLIPYRFQFTNQLTKNHKLLLAFDALVLSEATGCDVNLGKIMHGDGHATVRVKLTPLVRAVRKGITDITALVARNSPPDLVLNRHCDQCEFQSRCRKQATEKDELSLLSGMSERERKKLHGKGIFTITQLSYTFRPRRRGREFRGRPEKFHYSLRAIAIREKKIHAIDLLAPQLDGTPVYLDVEGVPDRNFYYLIGVRVGTGDDAVQYSFWADDENGEKRIWNEFLNVLSATANPRLIHFGSYETTFLKRMSRRHGGPHENSTASSAIKHAVNLLSFIFAHIYFPTFSNGLKEIAGYFGFRWSGSPASGLEAIVWRDCWEGSKDLRAKQALLNYNREDCEAVELVANKVIDLYREMPANGPSSQDEVIFASEIRQESRFPVRFGPNTFALPELEIINKAAYWSYQRERVYVRSRNKYQRERERHLAHRKTLMPNTIIECPRATSCPTCKCNRVYSNGKRSKTLVDLRFMRHGIKRWITRYVRVHNRCPSCGSCFYKRDPRWPTSKYGTALAAYTVYQNIELHLPLSRVASSMGQLFGLYISRSTANELKAITAQAYAGTHDGLLNRLCCGRLLHIDETSAHVIGKSGYVWVFTSMEEVAFFYSPTREGGPIKAMLKNFSGVLVSDFYAPYDAIECAQQKCLIHLIRDLNDELLRHPFDDGLKRLVADFAGLVRPMIETVDRCGLKKHFLAKHLIFVDRFYKRLGRFDTSEVSRKIIERLQKNRNKLFTFLEFDGIPWNNNNAEHAIKAFASLRRVIEGKSTEKGLRDFLILLSICETCKYKGVHFLDFLRSGSKDIDGFVINRREQRLRGG